MRYIKVTGINRWLREMGLLLVILTVSGAALAADCSIFKELGFIDRSDFYNQDYGKYTNKLRDACKIEYQNGVQSESGERLNMGLNADNVLTVFSQLKRARSKQIICTDSRTQEEHAIWLPIAAKALRNASTDSWLDNLSRPCKEAFKEIFRDATGPSGSSTGSDTNRQPSQSNSDKQAQQRAQEARQQTQQNQQRSSDAEELAASNRIIGSQKQSAQEFQQKADQARQGKRRRHEPENEASHCIQPDFGGLYGGMKNTCNFKVWYTYCGYRPSERSWLTGMNCEKQSFGSDSVMPGNTSASHTHGVQQLYWFACKEPAWPLDHEFVVGSGIRARCYTVGGN